MDMLATDLEASIRHPISPPMEPSTDTILYPSPCLPIDKWIPDEDHTRLVDTLDELEFPSTPNRSRFDDTCMTVGLIRRFYAPKHPVLGKRTQAASKVLACVHGIVKKLYPDFSYSSVHINRNFPGTLHVDRNNAGPSLMLCVGKSLTGGELWVDGQIHPTVGRCVGFDGNTPHMTMTYEGSDRYSVVMYTPDGAHHATEELLEDLVRHGFPCGNRDHMPRKRHCDMSVNQRIDAAVTKIREGVEREQLDPIVLERLPQPRRRLYKDPTGRTQRQPRATKRKGECDCGAQDRMDERGSSNKRLRHRSMCCATTGTPMPTVGQTGTLVRVFDNSLPCNCGAESRFSLRVGDARRVRHRHTCPRNKRAVIMAIEQPLVAARENNVLSDFIHPILGAEPCSTATHPLACPEASAHETRVNKTPQCMCGAEQRYAHRKETKGEKCRMRHRGMCPLNNKTPHPQALTDPTHPSTASNASNASDISLSSGSKMPRTCSCGAHDRFHSRLIPSTIPCDVSSDDLVLPRKRMRHRSWCAMNNRYQRGGAQVVQRGILSDGAGSNHNLNTSTC